MADVTTTRGDVRKLAEELSRLLNNPDLPANLYEMLSDTIVEFSNTYIDFDSPDYIELCLKMFFENASATNSERPKRRRR